MTIRFALIGAERQLLGEIADLAMTQKDVTLTYALAIQSGEEIDWSKVNTAIIERWSFSGLRRIKEKAWRLARQPATAQAVAPKDPAAEPATEEET